MAPIYTLAAADRAVTASIREVAALQHAAGNPLCSSCAVGYPVACQCGGWVHAADAAQWGDTSEFHPDGTAANETNETNETTCDRCGPPGVPLAPLILDDSPHAPGRGDCPACVEGGPVPCLCGGQVHRGMAGSRRCDRCGGRYTELDI